MNILASKRAKKQLIHLLGRRLWKREKQTNNFETMDFRHISKGLSQANKPHKNRTKAGGKVETRALMSTGSAGGGSISSLGKQQRF